MIKFKKIIPLSTNTEELQKELVKAIEEQNRLNNKIKAINSVVENWLSLTLTHPHLSKWIDDILDILDPEWKSEEQGE